MLGVHTLLAPQAWHVFYEEKSEYMVSHTWMYCEEPCAENRKSELSSLQGQITYTVCADKQPLQYQSKTDKENLKNVRH